MATESDKAIALIARVEQFYRDLHMAVTLGRTVYGGTAREQYKQLLEAAKEMTQDDPRLPDAPDWNANRPMEQTTTIMVLAGQLGQWLRAYGQVRGQTPSLLAQGKS